MILPGSRLGPYEIVAPLGAGGMGEVYLARDGRLDRGVAIKVLPERLASDPQALSRFERESKAVAALSHPNILAIHDVGEHEGVRYAVTELLDGSTLGEQLAGGSISQRKAVEYALQIAQGLAAAHEKGIVHRDLKPENLFVTRSGHVKILDFGLAKTVEPADFAGETSAPTRADATEPGTVLGTVGYMSPEQVRGRPADARSDIFSFGIVFYEMLTGRRAFRAESPVETMNAILTEEPAGFSTAGGRPVPPGLERLVRRCLEKSPTERFQSARDLGFAIEAVSGIAADDSPGTASAEPAGTRRSIAVLPFRDLQCKPENADLGLGLADATTTELASLRSLLVRPTASILKYNACGVDPHQAARELGVYAVVDGNFQRFGNRLRVTVQLVRASDGRSLWGSKIDTSLEDIFQMQDLVSRKIVEALQVELTPGDEMRLARGAQSGGEAYELYLRGRIHLYSDTSLEEVNAAIELLEKACEVDPGFAPAWVALADAYLRMAFSFDPEGDWYARAEAMCEKALALEPGLPEGRYLRGRLLWNPARGWGHGAALSEFLAAIAARPGLIEAYNFAAQVLVHTGLLDEAVEVQRRALEIDPGDTFAETHLGLARYLQGRYPEALELTERVLRQKPAPWGEYQRGLCELRLGRPDAATKSLERGSRQFPGHVLSMSLRGVIAGVEGDTARAKEQIELIVRNRKSFGHYHHAQYDVACIYALLGEKEKALEWLAESSDNGFPCYSFFERDPLLDSIRREDRFGAIVENARMKAEPCRALYREFRSATSSSENVS